ncbi:MAG: terminase large subunit [Bacteroides sp.]|jgi:phage terminase large subunit-like protein|nr:terminase large subunit [Bacteroides sp.]
MKSYYQYAQDVLSGKQVAGDYIKLACERFLNLLDDDRYEFKEDKVDTAIEFVSYLKHFAGKHSGEDFILEPWQAFIFANVYGFFNKEDGSRLTQTVYIEIARKNGKSALAAAMGLNALVNDDEAAAEVYFAANSKDQVKISAWPLCSNFAKGFDPTERYLSTYRDTIKYDKTLSFLKVLASDSTKLDGPNASTFILDEYHAAKNNSMKGVLESGQGTRENPLAIIITTAGFNKLGPCYELRTTAVEILNEVKTDNSFFAAIYSLDEKDDWKDEKVWIKSNPNLGVTVRPQYLKKEIKKALNTTSDEVNVKTKNLNVWCDSETVWIPDDYILSSTGKVSLKDYKEKETYVGIDLSSTSDLTAVAYLIPMEYKYYFKIKYYLPEAALKEKRFSQLYGEWRRRKLITITPGNVTDYDYILNDLMEQDSNLYIMSVGYDQWNATQFVINATDKGLPMIPISQSIGNFNKPTKEMERLILSGKVVFDNNEITRHCFKNVVIARDKNGNVKPSKQFEEKKIDGIVAALTALEAYLESPRYISIL